MRDGLDDVRALLSGVLPDVRLSADRDLGGSDRSRVSRVHARWPDGAESSVVVKQFLAAGEGWAREAAALATLPDEAPVPRLIAEGAAPPVVVATDLGAGSSVADALLGDDRDAAVEAVLSWAEAMARLHRSGLGRRDRFRAELALRAGDLPVVDHVMPAVVDEAALLLERRCDELGVAAPRGAYSELRQLARDLGAGENASISPSDACPDDNVQTADGLMIVDFEGAQWRHVAWDLAYLSVPWPTCWCAWRMPADVSERALERYRHTIEDALPYVRTARFRTDVAAAALGWAMVSAAWLLPEALDDDPPPRDPAKVMPRRRALILHRLDVARRSAAESAPARLAGQLRSVLLERWGEPPLGYAPAFDSGHAEPGS
ncbi:MAG TPA: hypothetical protein VIG48_05695 [Jatrophihabitans sp.]